MTNQLQTPMAPLPRVEQVSDPAVSGPRPSTGRALLPGLVACLAAALVGLVVRHFVPAASPLLVAILLGVLVANARRPVEAWQPGVGLAARHLLRAGIVLLGLGISLQAIAGLGWAVLALVTVIVTVGLLGTYGIGRALGLPREGALLVASGCSICGAAAVAAVEGVIRPRKEYVATAVALVVLFGTAMIPIVPLVARVAGLPPQVVAIWAGGGTHEVAQVVAIGGIAGGGTLLATAVVVKLARVVLLAPVTVVLGIQQRRLTGTSGRRPPLVQPFVVGFVLAVLLRSSVTLPAPALALAGTAQTLLLSMAMFALGLGVSRAALARASGRSVLLGLCGTVLVNVLALGGALLVARAG
ncbi:YeiH family protein [Raineyella antarctica]|uniref:YeiH family protein n=1 Tax=Raineyella antarctica TaxID=1577474 RepID=UPI001FE06821|nr:putative sulfate exporter family transporter [Raineyella antarctica]